MKYTPGSVKARGNGSWQARLRYKDEQGTWQTKTTTIKATSKRAADKKLAEWRAEMEAEAEAEALAASGGANPNETVADYVAHYIDGRITHVESSSIKTYRGLLRKQIEPYIGSIALDDLEPDNVDKWLATLSEEYQPVTVKKAFTLLKSAMTQAVDRDRLAKNPTRTVKPPKLPSPKPNALTERDLQKVLATLDTFEESPALLAAKAAIYSGLRQEELCALRWKNVNLDECSLNIVEAIGGNENGYYIKSPKSSKSNRTVFYPAELADSLSSRKSSMERECLEAGIPFTNDLFVFGGVDGSYMQPRYMWKKWHQLADALDLIGTEGKRVTFHDLRHSYATIAIHNGIDVKTISNSMGHSNAAMTLNTYTSVNDDAQRRAAQAMGDALANMSKRGKRGASFIDINTGTEG